MLNKTFELIDKFQPVTLHIPVDKCRMDEVVETLVSQMFPFDEKFKTGETKYKLKCCVVELIASIAKLTNQEFAENVIYRFFESFPGIRTRLYEDAACYLKNDPAAKSLEEVILAYPGFFALSVHRIAHQLCKLEVPIIPRLFAEYAHSKVGIDIHPAAKIGKNLFMDHGTGIVIGETTEIGNNVKIYQGVTLGGTGKETGKRHPTIEDNVMISVGAKILGSFTIGENSKIGAGSVVLNEVPPNSTVVGVPGRVVKRDDVRIPRLDLDQIHYPDPISMDLINLHEENEKLRKTIMEICCQVKLKKENEDDTL